MLTRLAARLACVSGTPFGRDVVPDVCRKRATSSARGGSSSRASAPGEPKDRSPVFLDRTVDSPPGHEALPCQMSSDIVSGSDHTKGHIAKPASNLACRHRKCNESGLTICPGYRDSCDGNVAAGGCALRLFVSSHRYQKQL